MVIALMVIAEKGFCENKVLQEFSKCEKIQTKYNNNANKFNKSKLKMELLRAACMQEIENKPLIIAYKSESINEKILNANDVIESDVFNEKE